MRNSVQRRGAAVLASIVAIGAAGAIALTAGGGAGTVDGVVVTDEALAYYEDVTARTVENAGGDEQSLRDAALAALRADYALLALGEEHGLTHVRDVDAILSEREAVNDERARSVAEGEVVYGRVRYAPREFVSTSLAELRTRLLDELSGGDDPVLEITDADVAAELEAHPEQWSAAATTYELTTVFVPSDVVAEKAGGARDTAEAVAWLDAVPLATLEALPGAVRERETYTAQEWEAMPYGPDARRDVIGAEPGARVGAYPSRAGWVVLVLDEAVVDADRARAVYGERVRHALLEDALDDALRARVTDQHVDLD